MSAQQSIDRKVTAPRDASPEIKALAQEVNALARKLDAATSRRDMAAARYDAYEAEKHFSGRRIVLSREARKHHTAQNDVGILDEVYRQALQRYRTASDPAAQLAAKRAAWLAEANRVVNSTLGARRP